LNITLFGLTLSSSWGNGHATPYRAILRALHQRGVRLTFYEKDVSYYAAHRDFTSCDYCHLKLYSSWDDIRAEALRDIKQSDIVITASYCPEGARISNEALEVDGPLHVFYDLDTPITLNRLAAGPLDYLQREQIPQFDLYLSFTGGPILRQLEQRHGAQLARPLHGCVDPDEYRRTSPSEDLRSALSYLGTYAEDRQQKLDNLFLEPARRSADMDFVLAGSLYPWQWVWPANVKRFEHIAPSRHPALYSSSRATLNITRKEMAEAGHCPSGRFFEAAACGTPIVTDCWEGLDAFFDTERELCVVHTADDVLSCLSMSDSELRSIGQRARNRTLEEHTGERRAAELLSYCEQAYRRRQSHSEVMA
jgi:spore maturation protein CgeB